MLIRRAKVKLLERPILLERSMILERSMLLERSIMFCAARTFYNRMACDYVGHPYVTL